VINKVTVLLEQGVDEDWLTTRLDVTHLELRQTMPEDTFSDSIASVSLQAEMQEHIDKWPTRKIAHRYRMQEHVTARILSGHYVAPNAKKPLDVSELKFLISLDMTLVQIAAEMDLSVYETKKAVESLGRPQCKRSLSSQDHKDITEALERGRKQTEIAEEFNVTPQLVSHIKRGHMGTRPKKRAVRADLALVVRLIDQGQTQESVARQLNIAQGTVSRLYNKCKNS